MLTEVLHVLNLCQHQQISIQQMLKEILDLLTADQQMKKGNLRAYNEFCVNGVKPEPGFRSEWPTDRRLAPSLEVALSIVWRCLGGPCTEA